VKAGWLNVTLTNNRNTNALDGVLTETNVHFLPDAELQEWNDAVDEYHQKVEAGETQ
jgi:hypothetical protein